MKSIAIIGNLVDTDIVLAEMLLRRKVQVTVFRSVNDYPDLSLSFYSHLHKENIEFFSNPLKLIISLRRYKFIYSITSSLFFKLKYLSVIYPLLIILGWPKYMVVCSGANITERAVEKSPEGTLERLSLRFASFIMLNNYPEAIKNALVLKLKNCIFLPYPYPVGVDLSAHTDSSDKNEPLLFFHPSNLDWGELDNHKSRKSTKGNDRFIRAFIKLCKNGLKAHCNVLERGPDIENAKRIITANNAESFFTWKKSLSRQQFHNELIDCDVVVDQFDIGGYGGISIEAMSYGKPVMVYLDDRSNRILFGNDICVINMFTEEQIEKGILSCQDQGYLEDIAKKGRDFVLRNFSPEVVSEKYLVFAELATGKPIK